MGRYTSPAAAAKKQAGLQRKAVKEKLQLYGVIFLMIASFGVYAWWRLTHPKPALHHHHHSRQTND